MRNGSRIAVVIPALDEEKSIGNVVSAIPSWVDDVVVADNGSTDRTAEVARHYGARVVHAPKRGYGSACLAGIAALRDPDVVVFLDGDFSDHPEEMSLLVDPILEGEADLVAGSRVLGRRQPGALPAHARFGNWLACTLVRLFWKARYSDLGPFRAIRATTLESLGMRDPNYGWMVEMQIKATRAGFRVREVAVRYRCRIGKSKISGTVKGTLGAGAKILLTIFTLALECIFKTHGGTESERLVLFTRYPEPGITKTRLIPALGPEGAANLQRLMMEHTLRQARQLAGSRGIGIEIRYEGGNRECMSAWLGSDLTLRSQGSGNLGERLLRAFREAFAAGAKRVVIVGSDCPGLRASHLRRAFDGLRNSPAVIGPARDGGYYLVGLRQALAELFRETPWGTERVLEETLRKARAMGIVPALLDPLDDVDRPEDLYIWEQEKSQVGG